MQFAQYAEKRSTLDFDYVFISLLYLLVNISVSAIPYFNSPKRFFCGLKMASITALYCYGCNLM